MDMKSLVMQAESSAFRGSGGEKADMLDLMMTSSNAYGRDSQGAMKRSIEDVHDVSRFHPFQIKSETKRTVQAQHKLRKAQIDPKLFKFRKSFLVRDFLAFCAFFILINVSVLVSATSSINFGFSRLLRRLWSAVSLSVPSMTLCPS